MTLSDPAVEYATAAAEKLEDVNLYVRWAALEVLATLGPEKAGSHVGAVAALLQDKYLHVQQAAIETLRELGEVAEKHADDVAVFLESDEKALRDAATATLAKMGDAGARASMQHILRGAENRLEDGVFAIAAEGIHLLVTTDQLTAAHMEQILSMDGTASEWAKVFQSLMKARVEVLQPFAAKLKKVKPVSNPNGPFENPGRMYSLQTALLDSVLGTTTKTNQSLPHELRDKQVAADRKQQLKLQQNKKDTKAYLAASRQPKPATASKNSILDEDGNLNLNWKRPTE